MHQGRYVDNSALFCLWQSFYEEVGQVERTKMIDREGHLCSNFTYLSLCSHQTWVVDQDVNSRKLLLHLICKILDGVFFCQVKWEVFNASLRVRLGLLDGVDSFFIFLLVPAANDDIVAISIECLGGLKSYPWVPTGDHNVLGSTWVYLSLSVVHILWLCNCWLR